jgi:hypothetical protein
MHFGEAGHRMAVPNREAIPSLFAMEPANRQPQLLQFLVQTVFGGCFQWVLDAACQAVEWLSQPLGFKSLALRSSLDQSKFA